MKSTHYLILIRFVILVTGCQQFPAGTWLEVKGLALPGQLIEIELEVYKAK